VPYLKKHEAAGIGRREEKMGPKSKSKGTEKLEKWVLAIRFKSPEKDTYEITDILT